MYTFCKNELDLGQVCIKNTVYDCNLSWRFSKLMGELTAQLFYYCGICVAKPPSQLCKSQPNLCNKI